MGIEQRSFPRFDDKWRERLHEYPKTAEYQRLLQEYKTSLIIPERKLVRPLAASFLGVSGIGKTSVARMLQEFIPAIHLQPDVIGLQSLLNVPQYDYYKAYVIIENLADQFLADGYSVIFDDNNPTRSNREEVYRLAKRNNAHPLLFELILPFEEAVQRAAARDISEKRVSANMDIEARRRSIAVFQSQIEKPTREEIQKYGVLHRELDMTEPLTSIAHQLTNDAELQTIL